jgi:transcriptional regulator with XRE-family HTH domain
MTQDAIKELRACLQLTQEVFARILGVSFATVNRWENGKAEPTGDYSRVLYTLQQLTTDEESGAAINWTPVGALSAMAAAAGFSPILTLGAVLAPQVIELLPSRDEALLNQPLAADARRQSRGGRIPTARRRSTSNSSLLPRKVQGSKKSSSSSVGPTKRVRP